MICKITNFLRMFSTEKNSLNALNFTNEKIRKIRILDLCLKSPLLLVFSRPGRAVGRCVCPPVSGQ